MATTDRRETDSGIEVKPVYSADDAPDGLEPPGEFPFTRGPYRDMYRGRPWTIRQYAGFASAEETNQRFRYLLERGQTGLSVAFDLPTQLGYDSDDPRAAGEVGRTGVAIDSLADMELLLDGIPLGDVSTSMTINAPAALLLLLYELVAEEPGRAARDSCAAPSRTTSSRSTSRAGTTSSRRGPRCGSRPTCSPTARSGCRAGTRSRSPATTSARRARRRCRSWRSRSRTASPTRRRPSTRGSRRTSSARGSRSSSTRTTTSSRRWRSSARRGGCGREIMRERFGATNPKAQALRFHAQTGGSTLTAQQPENNVVRVAVQALSAVCGGAQSIHTNSFDEALALADRAGGADRAAHAAAARARGGRHRHGRPVRRLVLHRGADGRARGASAGADRACGRAGRGGGCGRAGLRPG